MPINSKVISEVEEARCASPTFEALSAEQLVYEAVRRSSLNEVAVMLATTDWARLFPLREDYTPSPANAVDGSRLRPGMVVQIGSRLVSFERGGRRVKVVDGDDDPDAIAPASRL